jgi:hypothetical protein
MKKEMDKFTETRYYTPVLLKFAKNTIEDSVNVLDAINDLVIENWDIKALELIMLVNTRMEGLKNEKNN